jgi:hypothetical protein
VRRIFNQVADCAHEVKGLTSGEGLKWAVRDSIEARDESKTDPGVADKRLLVVEAEFAQALRVAARPGNTLSVTVRDAWDSGRLATLTKNDPVTATGAHIGIIGHITAEELRRELTETDTANGFANRFLFACVRRSNVLPFGGAELTRESEVFAKKLHEAAMLARTRNVIGMSEAAKNIWIAVYPKLSAGHLGLFGAATARAEAQCLRLALLYALLDKSDDIKPAHLKAALAVWDYCEASAALFSALRSAIRLRTIFCGRSQEKAE